jgi:hypothetical protein
MRGHKECAPSGSLHSGQICELGNGTYTCGSLDCVPINYMDQWNIDVCGECYYDEQCSSGYCQEGSIDTKTGEVVGSYCILSRLRARVSRSCSRAPKCIHDMMKPQECTPC